MSRHILLFLVSGASLALSAQQGTGPSTSARAEALLDQGTKYHNAKQWKLAEAAYKEGLQICRELVQAEAEQLSPSAIAAYRDQHHGEAPAQVADLKLMVFALHRLGELCAEEMNRPKEAEVAFTEALQIYRTLYESGDSSSIRDLAETLNALGKVAAKTNRPDQAEATFKQALSIYRDLTQTVYPGDASEKIQETLENLGDLYGEKNRPQEAEAMYKESLRTCQGAADNSDQRALCTVSKMLLIGRLYSSTKRLKEAEGAFLEALRLSRIGAAGDSDYLLFVFGSLNEIGKYYKSIGQNVKAAPFCTEARTLVAKLASKEPGIIAAKEVCTPEKKFPIR
jgi:tetratricopeptide (TPR) repeat protein